MRPIAAWTLFGIALPIALFGIAVSVNRLSLAIVACGIAVVSPTLGHLVCRRTLRTRGFYVRLAGDAMCGVLLAAVRGAHDLGGAIGALVALILIGLATFAVGAGLDLSDCYRLTMTS